MRSKKNRKKIKKFRIFLLFLSIVIVIFLIVFFFSPKEKDKLLQLGYTKEEKNIILNKVGEENIDSILKYGYNKNIILLMKEKAFQKEHLKQYIEALSLFQLPIKDIIFIVNSENYNKRYPYDSYLVSVMKSDYYIPSYLDRYIKYYQNNKNIKSEELITRVNSNLDYPFYTDSQKTDLSKGYLMIVNKYYHLDRDYVPQNLVTISSEYGRAGQQVEEKTYKQYIKMYQDAKKEGIHLYIISPYRSYARQNNLYQNYVARDGKQEADTYSARPGFSEHQTGLALDILSPTSTMDNFITTKEYHWLLKNAYKYGFILRYPKGKEYITGYMFESWHYRYVGEEVSTYIQKHQITYEEYYAYFVKEKQNKK